MFTPTQLKDLEIMIEFYRDSCDRDAKKFHTTESAKRMYAAERLKADEFLELIAKHVEPFTTKRYDAGVISAYGSDG
jgi:hypothetical protein